MGRGDDSGESEEGASVTSAFDPLERPNILLLLSVKSFSNNTERSVFLDVTYPYKNEVLESMDKIGGQASPTTTPIAGKRGSGTQEK